ncbi:MAG: hypothetical protein QUU85_19915, partial [Candidatus Eisenbacteria bacterium]|nr:hypothetical protein [Candidatus Eisenbacteria bacterium]
MRREWIERPEGDLGRVELQRLASRLESLPAGTRRVRIEWGQVRHLDFRAIPALGASLAHARRFGVEVRGIDCDPYLAALLSLALDREDAELLTGARRGRRSRAAFRHAAAGR